MKAICQNIVKKNHCTLLLSTMYHCETPDQAILFKEYHEYLCILLTQLPYDLMLPFLFI